MLGQFVFYLIAFALMLIPFGYIRAKMWRYHDIPEYKRILGPFTKGWIVRWFATWGGCGLIFLFWVRMVLAGVSEDIMAVVGSILFVIDIVGASVLQNYIDNKP